MNLETRKSSINSSHYVIACLYIVALVTVVFHLTGKNVDYKERKTGKKEGIIAVNDTASVASCNLFSGRWIFDNVSKPLYEEGQCPFDPHFDCHRFGRKDVKYQKFVWQPHHCDLPRFNGTKLLEKIRGKRLVFVGDSLARNQYVSMLCLVYSSLHQSAKKFIRDDRIFIFTSSFLEYNATIEFYWSPFLVESNYDNATNHSIVDGRIIRITSIEKHARHWNDADILIFDTFLWWLEPTMTILYGSFGSSEAIYKKVEMKVRRYEMALNTWSDWLEININRTKTKLFFMSASPYHADPQSCYNETEPFLNEGHWGSATEFDMMHRAESVIRKLETRGLHVEYLNVTDLSSYRKDAHPSIYTQFFHKQIEKQLKEAKSSADCVHWCLPGVPDVWNVILYSYIIKS